MPVLINGSQFISQVKMTDSDLIQGCITKSFTPHNDQGQPIRPADFVRQHIAGLEQELSQLDEAAWNLTGLEREKIIADKMEPLEERLQSCKQYLRSIENANWDGFELPDERDLEVSFARGLMNSHYHLEEVDHFLPGHTRSLEERRPPSIESKPSRSVYAQERSKKCREIAQRIWDSQPDFTISGMINRSEIVRHARQIDGSPYSEATVRNWIRDLCPNRKPGRRPAKNSANGMASESPPMLQ